MSLNKRWLLDILLINKRLIGLANFGVMKLNKVAKNLNGLVIYK